MASQPTLEYFPLTHRGANDKLKRMAYWGWGEPAAKHLVLCDASALPFREGVFTLVTASMVLEHLEIVERALLETLILEQLVQIGRAHV